MSYAKFREWIRGENPGLIRDWLRGSPLEPINPHCGTNNWKEFLYDCRHPILWVKRGCYGLKLTFKFIGRGFKDPYRR